MADIHIKQVANDCYVISANGHSVEVTNIELAGILLEYVNFLMGKESLN